MRILLTGGAGYIGSHTAVFLSQLGHRIILLDNFVNSDRSVISRINSLSNNPVSLEFGDIRDTDYVRSVLRKNQIDVVVHLAGLKSVSESMVDPVSYFDFNCGGTLSLVKAMIVEGVNKLVFSSSATVYGRPKYLPLDEIHPTSFENSYGLTKLQVEQLLSALAGCDPSWRIAILRYFNPVGAHESHLIGEMPTGNNANLMPYLLEVASGTRPFLSIFGNDYDTVDGTGVRDYIHIMDLAEGHGAAIDFLGRTDKPIEIFNLGTGRGTSVLEFVEAFELATGKVIPIQFAPRRVGDVGECWADPAKAWRLLGWRASRNLHEMCSSAWLFRENIIQIAR